ncbi:hypothetical protein FJY63_08595, partial [Candidatus Sumerlaeota bacterium]|nr:hypothetical protein [Candidatus Sumerlaeota bacterium]
MSETYRQEVFNVLLAQLLQERGVVTAPESIIKSGPEQARRIPDVIVSYYGLRTVIEGEVADQAAAQTRALEAASRRVSQGIAHIAIAVVYPEHLRHVVFPKLKPALAEVELQIAVATEAGETEYTAGNADYLESTLRRAFEQLLKEDVVTRAAALIRAGIEQFSDYVAPKRGISSRMYKSLGMRELRPEDGTSEAASAAMELSERQRASVARVGALVMLNALIFQEILAYDDNRVRHISAIAPKASPWDRHKMACEFGEHWQFILEEINYYPIFHLACQVLWEISTYSYALMALERLAAIAQEIVSMRAALRHDLMGRVYHRLLADAKYLGTYYTSVPAAALLLKLALRSEAWPTMEWHDATKVAQLRIADLACGTGTLLMAAADAVTDNHISASAKEGLTIESDKLQRLLAEATLYGYDVLPSAIHLTASTLALRAPRIPFNRMNLFSLPLGGHELRLGSIEFLKGPQCQMAMDLFGATAGTQRVTGMGEKEMVIAEIPDIDLCVMNPPFTRSVGGNLLFGSVPEPERRLMQDELKKLVKKPRNTNAAATANVTAGLGSVFVAAADPYIKQGGRIALVLPKAFLSGVAWARTRNLLSKKYRVEYIVASHDPQRWNFSENTDLSEVLVVATKIAANNRRPGGAGQGSATSTQHSPLIADPPGDGVVGVNLWRNP